MKIARQELAKPLERAVADGHPWVYRDALARKGGAGSVEPGTVVDLHDRRGRFLARGVADSGPIALRLWSMRRVELDRGFFLGRIASALALRERLAVPNQRGIES